MGWSYWELPALWSRERGRRAAASPGPQGRRMPPGKRSSALVRSRERAAAARAAELGTCLLPGPRRGLLLLPSSAASQPLLSTPWSSLGAAALPGALSKLTPCPSPQ